MNLNLIEIITAGLGTAAFSLVFNIKKDKILTSALGGIMAWTSYLIIYSHSSNNFFANMVASFAICMYAEIFARILKAPANIFLVPAIFPLVPGGSLYYTMDYLIRGDRVLANIYGGRTIESILGIVVGIVLGTSFFYSIVLRLWAIVYDRE